LLAPSDFASSATLVFKEKADICVTDTPYDAPEEVPLEVARQSREKTEEILTFFDAIDLFKNFVNSNILRSMHLGLGP